MELGHNAIKLNAHKFYRTSNAGRIYQWLKDFMEMKRERGLRVRYNVHERLLELGCRNFEQLRYVERQIRSEGFSIRETDWPTRDLVKE